MADRHEQAGHFDVPFLTGTGILQPDPGDHVVAVDFRHDTVPGEGDLLVLVRPVGHDLRRPQLVAAMNDDDLLGELGQVERVLHRGVTAAHDG